MTDLSPTAGAPDIVLTAVPHATKPETFAPDTDSNTAFERSSLVGVSEGEDDMAAWGLGMASTDLARAGAGVPGTQLPPNARNLHSNTHQAPSARAAAPLPRVSKRARSPRAASSPPRSPPPLSPG